LPASGRSLVGYEWSMVSNPGVLADLAGAANAAELELPALAVGTAVVSLTVVDDAGQRSTVQRSVVVAAAPPPVADAPAASGGGGGASSVLWVGLLAMGVAALLCTRPRATAPRADPRSR
jgi:hypothetical protein